MFGKSLGIRCSCGEKTDVIDSRDAVGGKRRRRHRCKKCGQRFTTHEQKEIAKQTRCFVILHTIGEDDWVRTRTIEVTSEKGLIIAMEKNKVVATAIRTPIRKIA